MSAKRDVPPSPSPEEIRRARRAAGLNTTEAAGLIYLSARTWEDWEQGRSRMPPDRWEAAQYKLALAASDAEIQRFRTLRMSERIRRRIKALRPRQTRFIEEYVLRFDADYEYRGIAYRRAGYESKNPTAQATRLLALPHIKAAITQYEQRSRGGTAR